ncbi:MAG: hypothetical protein LBS18_04280 [Clostridiales bacterium]|nr:hypothetical protein [Clostridiales bacterium]
MKHKMMIAMCCILLLYALTGCQLALENAGTDTYEDRLAGIFVTTQHLDLFDMEGYLNDSLKGFQGGNIIVDGDIQKYQGRLYAALRTRTLTNEETGETSKIEDYAFPVDGISCFVATVPAIEGRGGYRTSISDPAISNGRMDIHVGDETNSTTLEGTIYVSPTGRDITYYLNPVYQSADGNVYVTTGQGISASGMASEGAFMSQTMDAATTVTENGKTKAESISIKLSISVMFPPEKTVILQMDTDSNLISRTEYAPGAMPEVFTPELDTTCFIVETYKRDDTGSLKISREIYDRDDENTETFFARADGICVKHWTQIKWK